MNLFPWKRTFYQVVICLCVFFTYLLVREGQAQELSNIRVTVEQPGEKAKDWIVSIEKDHNVRFFFKDSWIEEVELDQTFDNRSLSDALNEIFGVHDIEFSFFPPNYVILFRETADEITNSSSISGLASQNIRQVGGSAVSGMDEVRLSGYLRDGTTGQPIFGGSLFISELERGVSTNQFGYYEIMLQPGLFTLRYSYVGMEDHLEQVKINNTGTLDIDLFAKTVQLEAVTVTEEAIDANVTGNQMGLTRLDVEAIRSIPAFLGEVDVIKSIQLLPGVTTVGEGAQGFNVRGGGPADNLVLLDGAPVFNPSHLFGFFSIFNANVVKDATLFKGHIPSRYGGRSASVLDVSLQQGNMKRWEANGGIGIVTSRLTVNGPLIENKLSVTLGARSSYSDWILNQVNDLDIRRSSASFSDGNLKVDYQMNANNKISASGYMSRDKFRFASDTLYKFQNTVASITWNHIFSPTVFSGISGFYSDYDFDVEGLQDQFRYRLRSGIRYMGASASVSYFPGEKHEAEFGINLGSYDFKPGKQTAIEEVSLVVDEEVEDESSMEVSAYAGDEWNIKDQMSLSYGLRYVWYAKLGPGRVFVYNSEQPLSTLNILDTLIAGKNEIIESYQGIEPRFSLRYGLNDFSSVKFSYNRARQNIHLISNSVAITPFDIWRSSGEFLQPQIADQLSLGYFRNFDENRIETSVELYYRDLKNVPQYKNQADLVLNGALETELINGRGRAYGLEFLIKKEFGRLNGWLSYTYARTQRKANGDFEDERINFGDYYPADFDRPHDITTAINYKISRRWKVSGNFTYTSGRPISLPVATYRVLGVAVAQFSERNQFRIPDYHRLDLSITLEGNHRRNKKWEGSWTFTVFNAYGRKNAYSVFFGRQGSPPRLSSFRLAVLGSVFPSLTYNFKFPK